MNNAAVTPRVSSYSVHRCAPDGTPMGALAGPVHAEPGRAVWCAETGLYGRVRLVWRCCGTALVEMITDPDDVECEQTVTSRFRLDELSPPPAGVLYSVPCVGASWSLYLPCGHLAGEGCDCDTLAAEADGEEYVPRNRSQWEISECAQP